MPGLPSDKQQVLPVAIAPGALIASTLLSIPVCCCPPPLLLDIKPFIAGIPQAGISKEVDQLAAQASARSI